MKSLRVRLILLFGVAILVAATLQFITSFQAAMREASKLFDYHMEQMALVLQDRDFEKTEWQTLPGIESNKFDFIVQVWTDDGAWAYQSRAYRFLPKQAALGYSTVTLDNGDWRIYAVRANGRTIQVAQKINARRDRAIALAFSASWPVIPVSLLLFFAAWWVVRSALKPLNRIGQELAIRHQNSIEPVSDEGVPAEVSLLVTELNFLLARMSQALQAQQRFVADAAHELRSPITALRLQVQNLGRSRDDVTLSQSVDRLLAGVDRASHLVEQLLVLARQDPTSQKPLELTATSLSHSVTQAISDLSPFADSKQIALRCQIAPAIQILGDAESLRVMICNILDNAIRYIPENGQVSIDLSVRFGIAVLMIEDSGAGIPQQERQSIFYRFYRVPGTRQSGSGLGLAIAKTIADRHQASITLANASLGGLSVTLKFPQMPR